METLVTVLHVLVCVFLMLTVLLQAGKGGGMGAAFGGGSSMGTVFGGSGAGNFLRRLTVTAAIIFMVTSMTLAWMATPSTDPLKEYWARQQAAATERESAHREALKTKGAEGKPEARKGAATPAADEGQSTLDSQGAGTAPASGAATAPEKGKDEAGAAKPGDDKSAADKAEGKADKSAADKPADKSTDDKSAADKSAADKPADKSADDKAAADKPADDKPTKSSDSK
ncbi:MAG TPA: preprotein translocase subunit SecG [Kofleriaceae bacterium]|nr:preprotein translocase subunit SecG [Kofleriaceae bacterium]